MAKAKAANAGLHPIESTLTRQLRRLAASIKADIGREEEALSLLRDQLDKAREALKASERYDQAKKDGSEEVKSLDALTNLFGGLTPQVIKDDRLDLVLARDKVLKQLLRIEE